MGQQGCQCVQDVLKKNWAKWGEKEKHIYWGGKHIYKKGKESYVLKKQLFLTYSYQVTVGELLI